MEGTNEEKFLILVSPSIPLSEKVEIYKSIDPNFIHRVSTDNRIYRILTEVSAAAGDYDTTLGIFRLNQNAVRVEFIRAYFHGVAYNKEAIGILESVVNDNFHVIICGYLSVLEQYPQLIIHAKTVYDALKLSYYYTETKMKAFMSLGFFSRVEIQYYEFLLQTGEYPYSYFKELPMTPGLRKWLDITDI